MPEKNALMKKREKEYEEESGPYVNFRYASWAKQWGVVLDGMFLLDDLKEIVAAIEDASA